MQNFKVGRFLSAFIHMNKNSNLFRVISQCYFVLQQEKNMSIMLKNFLPQIGHLFHAQWNILQFIVRENKSTQIFHIADSFWQACYFISLQP